MKKTRHSASPTWFGTLLAGGAVLLCFLSACSTRPTPPPAPVQAPPLHARLPGAQMPGVQLFEPARVPQKSSSVARSPKEYRQDAAAHLYALHAPRIYSGRLPPMLEAVGVLNVDIDQKGSVKALQWMRAPQHAPHVMKEIERLVKSAEPYPVPKHLSRVTYTDTWLWHKSGKFQLDTLTEGQD